HASPASVNHLCGHCHSQHLVEMPSVTSDPAWARFPGSSLPKSRCYTESGGAPSCSPRHDPHRAAERSPTHHKSKGLPRHTTSHPGRDELRTTDPAFRSACPVNPKRDCVECHMPTVPYATLHTDFTDHLIRIPDRSAAASRPSSPVTF